MPVGERADTGHSRLSIHPDLFTFEAVLSWCIILLKQTNKQTNKTQLPNDFFLIDGLLFNWMEISRVLVLRESLASVPLVTLIVAELVTQHYHSLKEHLS